MRGCFWQEVGVRIGAVYNRNRPKAVFQLFRFNARKPPFTDDGPTDRKETKCSDCGRRQVLVTPTITMWSLVMAKWHRREWPVYEIYGDRAVPDMSSASNVGHGC